MEDHSKNDGLNSPKTKLDWLLKAASEAFQGATVCTNAAQQVVQLQQQDRNNFHGYARSPTEQDSPTDNQNHDRDSDEVSGSEVKERRRNGGRDEHNKLEKDRRAQLKVSFIALKEQIPALRDRKASNQAILKGSQKYIQALTLKGRKYEQEIQELARVKALFLTELSRAKQVFEATHGISADAYLQGLGEYDPDDQGSDATLSATEGPDNMHDFDDEEDEAVPEASAPFASQPQMPPPPAPQNPRGIPHSVIRQAPSVHQRPTVSAAEERSSQTLAASVPGTTATPVTVRKQLHAKLTSTKQAVAYSDGAMVIRNKSGPAEGTIQVITMPSMEVSTASSSRTSILSQSAISTNTSKSSNSSSFIRPAAASKVPIPQSRNVVQSLLTSVPSRSLLPTIVAPCTTAAVMVGSPMAASSALVTAEASVPHINPPLPVNSLVHPLKEFQVLGSYPNASQNPIVPSVLVRGTPLVVPMQHGSSVFVVPSTQHAPNPSMAKNEW